jgi:hypothetical protein
MAKAAISEMSSSHASIPASQKGDETLVAENAALLDALTLMWERYEGGVTCHECDEEGNVQEDSSSIGNAVKLTYEEEEQILSLLPKSLTKQAHGNGGTE